MTWTNFPPAFNVPWKSSTTPTFLFQIHINLVVIWLRYKDLVRSLFSGGSHVQHPTAPARFSLRPFIHNSSQQTRRLADRFGVILCAWLCCYPRSSGRDTNSVVRNACSGIFRKHDH